MSTLISNGLIIDPSVGRREIGDVFIKNGRIADLETARDVIKTQHIIDATDKWVVPGLIDMHVHLRDFEQAYKEDIRTGLEAAARGGFTAVVAMANTNPVCDNADMIRQQILKADEAKFSRLLPVSSITKGMNGKCLVDVGKNLYAGAVAFSEDGKSVEDADVLGWFMQHLQQFVPKDSRGVPVLDHCDDVKGEEYYVNRDIMLAKQAGCRIHLQHISTAESVELIRKAKKEPWGHLVTAEAAPHHFTLTDADFEKHGPNAKMAPPLRTEADRQAIINGLLDGTIDCIASDHAPHAPREKTDEKSMNGIIGLETSLGLSLTELYHKGLLSDMEIIQKMSTNPAHILNLMGGTLAVGTPADITIIDPNKKWIVNSKKFASKSKNMPYEGLKLVGLATHTIRGGDVIFQR